MPILEKRLFKCIKCSYKEHRLIDKDRYDQIEYKCPSCGSYIKEISYKNITFLDELREDTNNKLYKSIF